MQNNNYEIGIIALDSHYEIVSNIIQILSGSPCTIHVLTTHSFNPSLPLGENVKIFKSDSGHRRSIIHFLEGLKKHVHLIVVTIYKDYRFFHQLSNSYSLSFIVHNTHFTFADNRYKQRLSIFPNNFKIVLRNLLFRESHYKKKLLNSCSQVYFLSLSTLKYASDEYSKWKSKFKLLPYIYMASPVSRSKDFTIVIPGGVNTSNREYGYLRNWLSHVSITAPIKIVFLGKSSSRELTKLLSELINTSRDQIEIIRFTHYVDQPTYDQWISRANFLLSALKKEVLFRGYREFYGTTKVTGSINDAVKNNVPLVIPEFYPIDPIYRSLVHSYTDLNSFFQIMDSFYMGRDLKNKEMLTYHISEIRNQMYGALKLGNP